MKTVVITGAAKGIGAACAEAFSVHGYNVVINYLHSFELANNLKDKLLSKHYSVCTKKADVSNYDEAKALIDFAYSTYGNIDVLVNNAGICHYGLLSDVSPDLWDKIMTINVKSAYNCSKSVIPYMLNKHSGKIINISSIWGISGASCEVAYSTSKAAIIGFTKSLSKELSWSNINVNCVAPGVVDTDMIKSLNQEDLDELKSDIPFGRFANPCDIAKCILFLSSDDANYITGEVLSPNGGFGL